MLGFDAIDAKSLVRALHNSQAHRQQYSTGRAAVKCVQASRIPIYESLLKKQKKNTYNGCTEIFEPIRAPKNVAVESRRSEFVDRGIRISELVDRAS